MKIKKELQKFFDKKIVSISKNNGYYYVVLNDGYFVKPIYKVDLENGLVEMVGINALELDKFELVYRKAD